MYRLDYGNYQRLVQAGIEYLNLADLNLTDIDQNLLKLSRLKYLDLSRNSISSIWNLDKLDYLESLYLNDCKLKSLDGSGINELENLKILSVSGNRLLNVNLSINLVELYIDNNSISSISEHLQRLDSLRILSASNNDLSHWDPILLFKNLISLNLSNCNINLDQLVINDCNDLQHLDISNNKCSSIRSVVNLIEDRVCLHSLNMSSLGLKKVFEKPIKCSKLNMSNNPLGVIYITEKIYPNLRNLNLKSCSLNYVAIKVPTLKVLEIEYNNIKNIPGLIDLQLITSDFMISSNYQINYSNGIYIHNQPIEMKSMPISIADDRKNKQASSNSYDNGFISKYKACGKCIEIWEDYDPI